MLCSRRKALQQAHAYPRDPDLTSPMPTAGAETLQFFILLKSASRTDGRPSTTSRLGPLLMLLRHPDSKLWTLCPHLRLS